MLVNLIFSNSLFSNGTVVMVVAYNSMHSKSSCIHYVVTYVNVRMYSLPAALRCRPAFSLQPVSQRMMMKTGAVSCPPGDVNNSSKLQYVYWFPFLPFHRSMLIHYIGKTIYRRRSYILQLSQTWHLIHFSKSMYTSLMVVCIIHWMWYCTWHACLLDDWCVYI